MCRCGAACTSEKPRAFASQHDKEKKEKKHKKKHKKHKASHDDAGVAPVKVDNPIGESDYFAKSAEFQLWLQEARGTFLDEMPSEDARKIFKQRFVPVSRKAPFAPRVRPLKSCALRARVVSTRSGMVESCRRNTTTARRFSLRRTGPGTSGALRIA